MGLVLDIAREWALLSLGGLALVVVFKATGVFNLAQGALMLLDAYLAYSIGYRLGSPWATLGIVLACQVPLALVAYAMFSRLMTSRALWPAAVVTLGLSVVGEAVISYVWHLETHVPAAPVSLRVLHFDGVGISVLDVAAIAFTAALFVAVIAGQRYTRLGLTVRATGENPLLASQAGIDVRYVFAGAWFAGFALAALAGALFAYRNGTSPALVTIGLAALAPAVLGGLDSLGGVFLGAGIAATTQQLAVRYLGGDASEFALFMLVLAVLVIRPYGFFGTGAIERA